MFWKLEHNPPRISLDFPHINGFHPTLSAISLKVKPENVVFGRKRIECKFQNLHKIPFWSCYVKSGKESQNCRPGLYWISEFWYAREITVRIILQGLPLDLVVVGWISSRSEEVAHTINLGLSTRVSVVCNNQPLSHGPFNMQVHQQQHAPVEVQHLTLCKETTTQSVRTTLQSVMNAKLRKHRFWHCREKGLMKTIQTIPHNL